MIMYGEPRLDKDSLSDYHAFHRLQGYLGISVNMKFPPVSLPARPVPNVDRIGLMSHDVGTELAVL